MKTTKNVFKYTQSTSHKNVLKFSANLKYHKNQTNKKHTHFMKFNEPL